YLDDLMRIIVSDLTGEKFDEPQEPKQVAIDPKLYDPLVGKYQFSPKLILTVKKVGNRLLIQLTGQQSVEIFPASETEYFCRVVDARFVFLKNDNGAVTSVMITQNGSTITAPKIK